MLPLIITLVAYSEVRGIWLIVVVIAITSWAGAARAKRAQIITLRNRDFITAAKFSGEGTMRIIFREIMPNMTSLVAGGLRRRRDRRDRRRGRPGGPRSRQQRTRLLGHDALPGQAQGAVAQGLLAWVFVPGLVLASSSPR